MNIDVLNKWLSAGASVAVMVGVLAAITGVVVAVKTLKQTPLLMGIGLFHRFRHWQHIKRAEPNTWMTTSRGVSHFEFIPFLPLEDRIC